MIGREVEGEAVMIDPSDSDKGRYVIYGRLNPYRTAELGVVSSWNEISVFVRYSSGDTAAATDYDDLEWLDDVPVGTNYRDGTSLPARWVIT